MRKQLYIILICASLLGIAASTYVLSIDADQSLKTHGESLAERVHAEDTTNKVYGKQYGGSTWYRLQGREIRDLPNVPWNRDALPPANQTRYLWEVTRHPDRVPTQQEIDQAYDLYNETYHHIRQENWTNHRRAISDGYKDVGEFLHWPNNEFIKDNIQNDPEKPEYLLYTKTPDGITLLGVLFFASNVDAQLQPPGGPAILPHFHIWKGKRCYDNGKSRVGMAPCNSMFSQSSYHSPQMYHVWFIQNKSGGPFSTDMNLQGADIDDGLNLYSKAEFTRRIREIAAERKNETSVKNIYQD